MLNVCSCVCMYDTSGTEVCWWMQWSLKSISVTDKLRVKTSQYGPPLQINILSVVCCVSHYHSYIPWHTPLNISCLCGVTLTHSCTVYTWHKRCVHVLCISFLCDVTLTHPCTVYTWHKRCVHVLSISFLRDVTLTHPCTVYTWHKRCVHVLSISFLCDVTLTHPCTVYTWHKGCVHVLSISFLCDVTHIHALCTRGTRDVSMCYALASPWMLYWHIHCVRMGDHGCIVVLGRSCFWIPILGQLNPF